MAGALSAAALRQLRTTKLRKSKELGQYRENPISANPVWGMIADLTDMPPAIVRVAACITPEVAELCQQFADLETTVNND